MMQSSTQPQSRHLSPLLLTLLCSALASSVVACSADNGDSGSSGSGNGNGNANASGSGGSGSELPVEQPPQEIPTGGDSDPTEFVSGGINIYGDPIGYDAFEGYGTTELGLLKAHASWAAIERARVHSFAYSGEPNLGLPSSLITREAAADLDLPANVLRVISVMDENDWEFITPLRDSRYTYRGFLTAVAKWPRFCAEKSLDATHLSNATLEDVCALELATVFAHFGQEVGAHISDGGGASPVPPGGSLANPGVTVPNEQWRQSLFYAEELGYGGTSNVGYRQCDGDWGKAFPCAANASYHGRGAKQLSYNYNYGPFSRAVFGPEAMEILLQAPQRVADEGWLALSSAFYFYMTPRSPKPSIHETVSGLWVPSSEDKAAGRDVGFGVSIQIINGGIECGGGAEVEQAANRRAYFQGLAGYLQVWDGLASTFPKHDCMNMQPFADGSDYQYPPSWVKDWSGTVSLAAWEEGPYSPLFPGDYYRAKQAVAATGTHWDWAAGKGAPID